MTASHPTQAILDAYLLAELDEAARREIEGHLHDCAHCRDLIAPLSSTLAAYRTEPFDAPPARVLHSLLGAQQVVTANRSNRRGALRLRALAAAVAGIAIFAAGFWYGRQPHGGGAPRVPLQRTVAEPAPAPRGELNIVFVSADPDRLGGLALRDSTVN